MQERRARGDLRLDSGCLNSGRDPLEGAEASSELGLGTKPGAGVSHTEVTDSSVYTGAARNRTASGASAGTGNRNGGGGGGHVLRSSTVTIRGAGKWSWERRNSSRAGLRWADGPCTAHPNAQLAKAHAPPTLWHDEGLAAQAAASWSPGLVSHAARTHGAARHTYAAPRQVQLSGAYTWLVGR